MIYQLTNGASKEELKAAGFDAHYVEHGLDLFPSNANGVSFTTDYISSVGDSVADLYEDMAAEQKARTIYENLIDLTDDPDVVGPLLWLRQREIVHFNLFKDLCEDYMNKGYGK